MIGSFDDILKLSHKKLSAEQRRAVFSDKATVVSAGAGSGKTTVLSLRFLRLIYERKSHADRILTLTFTRKAASEMYERIHGLLSLAASNDESGYLQNELESFFPKAQISTMDGFWTEIARAGALDFGVSRDFSLMSNDDSADMIERVIEDLSDDGNATEAYMFLSSVMTPDDMRTFLSDIASRVDILTDYDPDAVIRMYGKFIELLKAAMKEDPIEDILYEIQELGAGADPGNSLYKEDLGKAIDLCQQGRYLELPGFSLTSKPKGCAEWNEVKAIVKERYRVRAEDYKRIAQLEINEDLERQIALFISLFIKRLQKERRASSMLSFSDIERIAEATLTRNRGVREYYKRRFDYIMIDEFQDNNEKQKRILYLLSESPDSFSRGIPDASELDKNKLFFVGDDKQSIYRFRGADVSVFNALQSEVRDKMGGECISLSANYRSEPQLVNHFNAVFGYIFSQNELSDDDAREERMMGLFRGQNMENFFASANSISAGRPAGNVKPVIELDVLSDGNTADDGGDHVGKEDAEAEFIALKIKEIVSSSDFMVGDGRNAVYEDIAILYGVTRAQMPIERALRRHGIPYTVVESTSVTVDGMSSDFYSFLQLVVYPNDKKSFLTVMKSPFVRMSDEGMLAFAGDNKNGDFRAFSSKLSFPDPEDQRAYDNAYDFYQKLKSCSESGTIASLMEMLFYESGYYSYIASDSRLAVYKEHFDYLWALANNADQRGTGLPLFLDSLRNLIQAANKLPDISIESLTAKGVSLMTIHKSKGLEFPIVILANSAAASSREDSQKRIAAMEGSEGFLLYDVCADIDKMKRNGISQYALSKPPLSHYFNGYETRRIDAERRRVLYVALTRAISHLIITACVIMNKDGSPRAGKSLYSLYREALDKVGYNDVRIGVIPYYEKSEIEYTGSTVYDKSWYDNALPVKEPFYAEDSIGIKEAVSDDFHFDGSAELLPDFPDSVDSVIADNGLSSEFGTLLHSALEEKLGGAPMAEYSDSRLSDGALRTVNGSARKVADAFIDSLFYRNFIKDRKAAAEVGFCYYSPSEGKVLSGSADLIVFCDDYNLVVDYKSDRYKNPEMHKRQLASYAEAAEKLYGKPCYARLCYLRDFSSGPLWDSAGNEVRLSI